MSLIDPHARCRDREQALAKSATHLHELATVQESRATDAQDQIANLRARISDLEEEVARFHDREIEAADAARARENALLDRLLAITNPNAARIVAAALAPIGGGPQPTAAPRQSPPPVDPSLYRDTPVRGPVLTPQSAGFQNPQPRTRKPGAPPPVMTVEGAASAALEIATEPVDRPVSGPGPGPEPGA